MSQEWIATLAGDIKQKNREAAQSFGRAQHYAGIISTQSKEYFLGVVFCLQEYVDALRSQLQGDVTSSETLLEKVKASEVKIARARFPWVDARLTHADETVLLDYAKGPGTAGDPQQGRVTRTFSFKVTQDDTVFVEDAFSDQPHPYNKPEDLARHIVEMLFGV